MSERTSKQNLRDDALRIWHAGLEAVRSPRLVKRGVRIEGGELIVGEQRIDLAHVKRIAVVGGGKAGAGMAAALEDVLGEPLMEEKKLVGWLNVPADCVTRLRRIHLHAARPAGINEPTAEGVAGSEEMLRIVAALGPDDLCICLISGGGSALMPAPVEGITLAEKLAITRHLSAAGANIVELNTVRKHLSRIKGGGLARACNAGRLVTLIISDVLGDPLDVIASGPTVEDRSTARDAIAVLMKYGGASPAVMRYLQGKSDHAPMPPRCRVDNVVLGNNAVAVEAAAAEARRLGYVEAAHSATEMEGDVGEIGRRLAEIGIAMRDEKWWEPNCFIGGGEGVVSLIDASRRGLGGRNQQTVLAALERLKGVDGRGVLVLSAGTDGEDGPTDAAGAFVDVAVIDAAESHGLDATDYLRRNDAYRFFEPLGALIKTGPTHTNVCDLRVVLVDRPIV